MPGTLDDFGDIHEDNEVAFFELASRYQDDFEKAIGPLSDRDDPTRLYLLFMNRVIAAAVELAVEPFASWENPSPANAYEDYTEFSMALERHKVSVQIKYSRNRKIYSVELDSATKQRIHFLIGKIRDSIEAADLKEDKKNSLFKKLNAFAADVDKARTTYNNVYAVGLDIAHLAKKLGKAIKPATEFVNSITELLAEAKAKEPEQQQLPPPKEQKRIPPPPKRLEPPSFSRDMDDDLPF